MSSSDSSSGSEESDNKVLTPMTENRKLPLQMQQPHKSKFLKINKGLKSNGKSNDINDKLLQNHMKVSQMMNKGKMFSESGIKIIEGPKYGKINDFVKKSKFAEMKNKLEQSDTRPDSKQIQEGQNLLQSTSAGNEIDDSSNERVLPRLTIHPKSEAMFWINMVRFTLRIYIAVVIPFRIPFENLPDISWVVLDCILNTILCFDIFIHCCTAYEDSNGKLVTSRKKIIIRYLKSGFIIHLISCIPSSLIRYVNRGGSLDDSKNFFQLKFERLPRFYVMLRAVNLLRISGIEKNYFELTERLKIPITISKIISIFWKLILILHIIACLWATSANFDLSNHTDWIVVRNIKDEDMYTKYLNSFYWATVTVATVGYGDITPTNQYEIMMTIFVFLFGCFYYSQVIGNLSYMFATILGEENEIARRKAFIRRFLNSHDYPPEIIDAITIKQDPVEEIIDVLPSYLKSQMILILYKEPIKTIKLLQFKNPHFILEYLHKLQPMIVKSNIKVITKNTFPADIFFIYRGSIKNINNDKVYNEGSVIGETDIIYKRDNRVETFQTIKECYLLRLDRPTFESLIEEVPEFRTDIEMIAHSRESARINQTSSFLVGNKQLFQRRKEKLESLLHQIDNPDGIPLDRKDSDTSSDDFSYSSSGDDGTSSEEGSSSENEDDNLVNKNMKRQESIRQSQDKITSLKRSLEQVIRKSLDRETKKNAKKSNRKTKHLNDEKSNPLESIDEDDEQLEGGEETKSKKKRVTKKKIKRPVKEVHTDLNEEIKFCLRLMNKARQIIDEYSKVFGNIESTFDETISISTKCRFQAEDQAIKMHKNIINMMTEMISGVNLKQSEEIIKCHMENLNNSYLKQKEYNTILDELHDKVAKSESNNKEELKKSAENSNNSQNRHDSSEELEDE